MSSSSSSSSTFISLPLAILVFPIPLVLLLKKLGVPFPSIKQVVISLFNLYKRGRIFYLSLFGETPATVAERRVTTGQSWDEFCDALKAAGAVLTTSGVPRDDRNQAEGYRYLSRLVRAGLENFVENYDRAAPKLNSIVDGGRVAPIKMGSDNPDNLYQSCPISSEFCYVVIGEERGDAHHLTVHTQAGQYGQPGGLRTVGTATIFKREEEEGERRRRRGFLVFASVARPKWWRKEEGDDGKGENIAKSKQEKTAEATSSSSSSSSTIILERNGKTFVCYWLPLAADPKPGMLIVRQTFLRRDVETPAEIGVYRVTQEEVENQDLSRLLPPSSSSSSSSFAPSLLPSTPFSCEALDDGLHNASLLVGGAAMMFARWANSFHSKHVNSLPLFDPETSTAAGGDPNIAYYHSYWEIASESAMVISAEIIPCSYWNFQVNNHFMESLEYPRFNIHVNNGTCRRIAENKNKEKAGEDAGDKYYSVCIVVADLSRMKKEGESLSPTINWLDTSGLTRGTMSFRFTSPKGWPASLPPQPRVKIVPLTQVVEAKGGGDLF